METPILNMESTLNNSALKELNRQDHHSCILYLRTLLHHLGGKVSALGARDPGFDSPIGVISKKMVVIAYPL